MLEAMVNRENRHSFRYEPVQPLVYLGWWEEPGFHTAAAELRNLSHGGALIVATEPPPETEALWLCMTGTPAGDWAGISLVSVTQLSSTQYEIRARFVEMCPYELFSLAVHGISVGS